MRLRGSEAAGQDESAQRKQVQVRCTQTRQAGKKGRQDEAGRCGERAADKKAQHQRQAARTPTTGECADKHRLPHNATHKHRHSMKEISEITMQGVFELCTERMPTADRAVTSGVLMMASARAVSWSHRLGEAG